MSALNDNSLTRRIVKDAEWIRQSFIVPGGMANEELDYRRRTATTASHQFTDTTPGGSFEINPPPQWTEFADLPVNNHLSFSTGVGRVWHECVQKHRQLVHIRAGVARFNSLTRFWGDFYSVEASMLARSGRAGSVFYDIGRVSGAVVTIGLMPLVIAAKSLRFFLNMPASKYYYLKPTMYSYWAGVSSACNTLAANMGIAPRLMTSDTATVYDESAPPAEELAAKFHDILPDVFTKRGGIDIFAMSTRAQRMANEYYAAIDSKALAGYSSEELTKYISGWARSPEAVEAARNSSPSAEKNTLEWYKKLFIETGEGAPIRFERDGVTLQDKEERNPSFMERLEKLVVGEARMGAEFVTFGVDFVSSENDSFSNSTKEPTIKGTFNSASSSAQNLRVTLADGNIESTGIVQQITQGMSDFMKGFAESLSIEGIFAAAGSSFVDIPNIYDSSSHDIHRTSLKFTLISPSNDPMSRFLHLGIPAMAAAGLALPLSTGKQSYTSPFLIEWFNKGHTRCSLGIVERLSFQRGGGEIGWDGNGNFLRVDVTMDLLDLSSIVHMPIANNFSMTNAAVMTAATLTGKAIDAGTGLVTGENTTTATSALQDRAGYLMPSSYDADNRWNEYMATWGSLSLQDQTGRFRKLKLRLTEQALNYEQWVSPSRWVSWMMDGTTGDILKAVSLETARSR